jgi:uncharacterized protein (TIGR02301 family)
MTPRSQRLAACAALLLLATSARDAAAQGVFDLFGDDRPAAQPRRAPPAARRAPPARGASKSMKKERRTRTEPAPKPTAAPAMPGEAPPPPYEPQLSRLAEVLGGLAFLRDVCEPHDGGVWREKMQGLLDAETPSGPRRQRLTAAFNRGFHSYELIYRDCTANAQTIVARYEDEAARLAHEVAARYGNQ